MRILSLMWHYSIDIPCFQINIINQTKFNNALPENIGFPLFPLQQLRKIMRTIMNTITQKASMCAH